MSATATRSLRGVFVGPLLAFALATAFFCGTSPRVLAVDPAPERSEQATPDESLREALQLLQRELAELREELDETRRTPPRPKPSSPQPQPAGSMSQMAQPSPTVSDAKRLPAIPHETPRSEPGSVRPPDLWSFQPLTRPARPDVRDSGWPRTEIDRFLLARLEQAGIPPNADADRPTLLRRIAYDLTGLPPTEAELSAFLSDPAGDDEAIARVVDAYLASPRFGERWGRHWLDIARYADSVGRTWNAPFTYAWRYRDYVIDAFNSDTPFDRFITEQLAGDLIPAADLDEERRNRTATGFLALGSLALNDGRAEGFLLDRVDDQIDVTTRAFLGLTVSCARCHDHKYDPVTMQDYYALAGIFYSTRTLSGQSHLAELGRGGYVDHTRLVLLPSVGRTVSSSLNSLPGVHSMTDFQEEWRRVRDKVRYTTHPDLAMGVTEGTIRDCDLRIQGDPYERAAAPARGDVRIPGLPRFSPISTGSSGRLELARWIASPENPLTARVAVNRVWLHLFGRGLVRTPDNFGTMSEAPTHPDLLDHLATRYIQDGWSTKRLIRTIVLSRAYRLSSRAQPAALEVDPESKLYWRQNLRRLEFEPLRDSLLHVSGRLDLQPPEGIQVAGVGGKGRTGITRSLLSVDAPYRTVYLPVLRAHVPDVYGTFDFPDPCQLTGQREITTVAPQALFFMNGDLVINCADDAADRLLRERIANDRERIRAAYRRLVSREPQSDEMADALDLLATFPVSERSRDAELERWSAFIQALMATAEFRYLR